MVRMFRSLVALLLYVCIATVIAQSIGLAWLWSAGYLEKGRLAQATAVLYGFDLAALSEEVRDLDLAGKEQPSLDQIAAQRAIKLKQIDLRELAVQQNLNSFNLMKNQLQKDLDNLQSLQQQFKNQLLALANETVEEGDSKVRRIFENVEPRQAKQLMLQMIKEDELEEVVRMYAAMAPSRQAEIAAEFKSEEETEELSEILRLVRKGFPQLDLINETQSRLEQPDAQTR